jgi:tetratricopeptide (TPR) repeat protein
MTCEEVRGGEIVEKYLLDQLDGESREAFEQHYFECAGCFGLLQTYRDLQAELARTRDDAVPAAPRRSWVWQWAWVPAMAAVCIAVGLAVWQRPFAGRPGPSSVTGPSAAPEPERPQQAPPPPEVSLADLARIQPPPYAPGRLRGAQDEATARYQEAMKYYQREDYAAAIGGLRAAAKLDPEAPHILFFLGISSLMAGQLETGIDALRRTLALGDSPYVEDAHFFLAKAYLRRENVDDARDQLRQVERAGGARGDEARQLLLQLERLAARPR